MVRKLAFAAFFLAVVSVPASAQILPATTQDLQQQANQTIQQATDAVRRDMQKNVEGQIQQRQDEQRLFSPVTNPSVAPNVVNPQPYDYQPVELPPARKAPPPKETQD